MTRIGGTLDLEALNALQGPHRETNRDADRMRHFHLLPHAQKVEAIQRLASAGMSDRAIAAATQLSVDQICRLLSDSQQTLALGPLGT